MPHIGICSLPRAQLHEVRLGRPPAPQGQPQQSLAVLGHQESPEDPSAVRLVTML